MFSITELFSVGDDIFIIIINLSLSDKANKQPVTADIPNLKLKWRRFKIKTLDIQEKENEEELYSFVLPF